MQSSIGSAMQSFEKLHGFRMLDKAREFYFASPHKGKLDNPYV